MSNQSNDGSPSRSGAAIGPEPPVADVPNTQPNTQTSGTAQPLQSASPTPSNRGGYRGRGRGRGRGQKRRNPDLRGLSELPESREVTPNVRGQSSRGRGGSSRASHRTSNSHASHTSSPAVANDIPPPRQPWRAPTPMRRYSSELRHLRDDLNAQREPPSQSSIPDEPVIEEVFPTVETDHVHDAFMHGARSDPPPSPPPSRPANDSKSKSKSKSKKKTKKSSRKQKKSGKRNPPSDSSSSSSSSSSQSSSDDSSDDSESSDESSSSGSESSGSDKEKRKKNKSKKHGKRSKQTRLPDPKELDDEIEGPKFKTWNKLMTNKMEINAYQFPTKATKLAYIYGRTTGHAQHLLDDVYMTGSKHDIKSPKKMMKFLAEHFVNANEEHQAAFAYKELLMPDNGCTINEFRTEFSSLAITARVSASQQSKDVADKLPSSYRKELKSHARNNHTHVGEMKISKVWKVLLEIENDKIEDMLTERNRKALLPVARKQQPSFSKQSSTAQKEATTAPRAPIPMDRFSSRAPNKSASPFFPRKQSHTPGPVPRQSREPTALADKCYNCDGYGHYSKDCPEPRRSGGEIKNVEEDYTSDEDAEADDEQSGNEQS